MRIIRLHSYDGPVIFQFPDDDPAANGAPYAEALIQPRLMAGVQ